HVPTFDLGPAGLDVNTKAEFENQFATGHALVRAKIEARRAGSYSYGALSASEAWLGAAESKPTGAFYRVKDSGIRCVVAPCPTLHEAKLNSSSSSNIADLDLTVAGASAKEVARAEQALSSDDGVLVAGTHARLSGIASYARRLRATEFYLKAE